VPVTIPTSILQAPDPTPDHAILTGLDLVDAGPGKKFYDIGCGNGDVIIAAAKKGCLSAGIEINRNTAQRAIQAASDANAKVRVIHSDATKVNFCDADIVFMYLYPPVIAKLLPQLRTLRPGTKVISYSHDITNLKISESKTILGLESISYGYYKDGVLYRLYVHTVPASQAPLFDPEGTTLTTAPLQSEVILYAGEDCVHCDVAKTVDLPYLNSLGVKTRVVTRHRYPDIPRYAITRGNKSKPVEGYISQEEILKILWNLET
jgi:SAM-dependent methyltransferase